MKKTLIGALASLMLAGALAAVNPATAATKTGAMLIIGEGSSPLPFAALRASDGSSLGK